MPLDSTGQTDSAAAVEALIANPPPHSPLTIEPGTYLVCARPFGFNLGNTTAPLHRAVAVNRSGLHVRMHGVTWVLRGFDAPGVVDVNYVFASDKHIAPGALKDIRFEGGTFDFNPARAGQQAGENFRSFHLVGVDHLKLADITLASSGARAGGTITVQNSRHVRVRRIAAYNITQAMNWRYVEDFDVGDFVFGHIGGEGIDFDSTVRRGRLWELRFNNPIGGPTGQALEMASASDIEVDDLFIRNYASGVTVLDKSTTQPAYADYVNNAPVTVQTVSRDLRFSNVTIEDTAPGGFAFAVSSNTGFAPERVSVEHLTMRRSGSIGAQPGVDLSLRDFDIRDARPPAGLAFGAIYAKAVGAVPASIEMVDGIVDGCSGSAVTTSSTRKFLASDVELRNYAGRGFHVQTHFGETVFENTILGPSTTGQSAATVYPATGQPAAQFRGRNIYTGAGAPPQGWAV